MCSCVKECHYLKRNVTISYANVVISRQSVVILHVNVTISHANMISRNNFAISHGNVAISHEMVSFWSQWSSFKYRTKYWFALNITKSYGFSLRKQGLTYSVSYTPRNTVFSFMLFIKWMDSRTIQILSNIIPAVYQDRLICCILSMP